MKSQRAATPGRAQLPGSVPPSGLFASYERVRRMALTDGVEIEYQVLGDWASLERVVVLIPDVGNLGIGNMWSEHVFVKALRKQSCTVIRFNMRDSGASTHHSEAGTEPAFDRVARGVGLSGMKVGRPPYNADDLADDVVEVLQRLCVDACHVVGYGYGGVIGRLLLTSHPAVCVSLTTIAAPNLLFAPPSRAAAEARVPAAPCPAASDHPLTKARYLAERARLRFAAGVEYNGATLTELFYQCLASIPTAPGQCPLAAYEAATARQEWAFESINTASRARKRLKALTMSKKPMLIVHGDHDPCVPIAAACSVAHDLQSASVVVLEGARHELSDTHAPLVALHIARLIDRATTPELRGKRPRPRASPFTPNEGTPYTPQLPDITAVFAYEPG
eukprot:TRINITY_DN2934_c0_g2_i1.p1 TRINITY_DN2934_c0_g2~~TRINITY_DN2934_c0_g2_i1.p1  ORF type:complete len:392 (+),score=91.40 TRINITY_DN2934_c0_g2_i1:154-1329(+)